MQEKMREHDLPLTALESGDPLSAFDFIGFTLQYEMCYTNVLNMLALAKLPLRTKDRAENDPIIIGGGPSLLSFKSFKKLVRDTASQKL